jgi:hypothetical protein
LLHQFIYGFSFALSMGLVRYFFATWTSPPSHGQKIGEMPKPCGNWNTPRGPASWEVFWIHDCSQRTTARDKALARRNILL